MTRDERMHRRRWPWAAAIAASAVVASAAAGQAARNPPPARVAKDGPAAPTALGRDPAVEHRVDLLLARLSPDEKIARLGGVNFFDVPGNARIGLPKLGTADSPFGVRADGPSTVYPGGIGLAATWNPALAERVGAEL